ncbi:hypothetical protein SDC9_162618 [bioreactor metagenome]|uniref:Uncharacterized protein n=1 Tax=bioreactor metagenome TaxID=1076179 RepID=A0A645FLJ9_9ZZZZ
MLDGFHVCFRIEILQKSIERGLCQPPHGHAPRGVLFGKVTFDQFPQRQDSFRVPDFLGGAIIAGHDFIVQRLTVFRRKTFPGYPVVLHPGKENLRQCPFLRQKIHIAAGMRNIPENRLRNQFAGGIAGIAFPLIMRHDVQRPSQPFFACFGAHRAVIGHLPGMSLELFGHVFRENSAYFGQSHGSRRSCFHQRI